MSERQKVHGAELFSGRLHAECASKLFFLSFRYSQGDRRLHSEIFYYLHTIHPEWIMSEELKSDMVAKTQDSIHRFLLPRDGSGVSLSYHSRNGITSIEIKNQLSNFADILQKTLQGFYIYPSDYCVIKDGIVRDMIERDHWYMCFNNGRFRRVGNQNRVTPATDPWLSHVVYYGLEGHDTGLPEFNMMFREVKDYIISDLLLLPEDNYDRVNLQELIPVYKQHHPISSTEPLED